MTASGSGTFSSAMAEALVRYEVVDGVGVISFNRPERHNAIDDETGAQWRARLDEAITDPAVRCVLLRGEGPSSRYRPTRPPSLGRERLQLRPPRAGCP